MRRVSGLALAVIAFASVSRVAAAQDNETSRAVAGGGISVPGWMGKIDAQEERGGMTLANAKFAKEGDGFHITTGPATSYWNPNNKAAGNYTVKATFSEPKYMNLNGHPHPYGIFIGGNDLGTADQSYLYCEAYGDGTFIVRGFAPGTARGTFQMGGRAPTANPAVNKAAGVGSPVKQEIAMTVSADKVSCSINGKEVASYPKADVMGAGHLKSTDGVYGLRSAHNTEVIVTGLTMTKQ